jgi:hypothetical protein
MVMSSILRRALASTLFASAPLAAQATPEGIVVEAGGATQALTATTLLSLPQDTVRARAHEGPEQVFVGPSLATILAHAGARTDSLRGRALARYVVIEARDGYRVVLAIAELSAAFTGRRVILAHTAGGQPLPANEGPWRLVIEGELRPARWVRQVTAIRVRDAPG